jgi:predicted membrane-bound dolichyl-phosphate-mannose-protein mannosyltransferase
MPSIEQLANLGGTLATVVIFVYYLLQRDKTNNKIYEEFNTTISNHLDHSTKVIERNNDIYTKIAVTLKELCLIIKKNGYKK